MAVGPWRAVIIAVVFGLLAAWPTDLESCFGPPLMALYTPLAFPLDIETFNKGNLGIVHPWYRRLFLVGVYRELK